MKKFIVQFCDTYCTAPELAGCLENGMLNLDWGFAFDFGCLTEAIEWFDGSPATCKWSCHQERFEITDVLLLEVDDEGRPVRTLGIKSCWKNVAQKLPEIIPHLKELNKAYMKTESLWLQAIDYNKQTRLYAKLGKIFEEINELTKA